MDNEIKAAFENLCSKLSDHWAAVAKRELDAGQYQIRTEKPCDEYDDSYSSICWGWLVSSDQTKPVVATYAHGERGNEPYDKWDDGLCIFMNQDAEQNARIEQAAKALISKTIGFSEFKSVVRKNL